MAKAIRALVLAGAFVGAILCYQAGGELPEPRVAVLELPGIAAAEPMMPFAFERQAEVVAFGTIGEPFTVRGRQLIALEIDKVLKGSAGDGRILAPDQLPDFGCMPPETPARASGLFAPGTRVVIYLDDLGDRWSLLSINRLWARAADEIERRIRRFAAVEAAAACANPRRRYDELLVPAQRGLDEPAYWALMHAPNRAALPALDKLLDRAVQATERGPGVADVAITRITHILTMLNEPDSIETLAIAIPRLERATRMALYPYLSRLAGTQEASRAAVCALLVDELDDSILTSNSYHYQTVIRTLGEVADDQAVERLLEEQAIHADDRLGQYVRGALRLAMKTASED